MQNTYDQNMKQLEKRILQDREEYAELLEEKLNEQEEMLRRGFKHHADALKLEINRLRHELHREKEMEILLELFEKLFKL